MHQGDEIIVEEALEEAERAVERVLSGDRKVNLSASPRIFGDSNTRSPRDTTSDLPALDTSRTDTSSSVGDGADLPH